MAKKRCWTFTYFPEDLERNSEWIKDLSHHKAVKNMFVGLETCPTSGKYHFQGYIRFLNAKDFKGAKRFFGMDKIHIEEAKGNDQHNYDYCLATGKYDSKEGHVSRIIEKGEPSTQGKRTDIECAIDIIKETCKMSEVLDAVPNYQACRHAELYLKYKEAPRKVEPIKVVWIWGSSGTGKTKQVYDEHPDVYRPTTFKWWEGYDGHDTILIDDFRRDYCKFHELLKLLDIYPFRVETKGGARQVQFKTIYITSPYSPTDTYETREDLVQLTRRITQIIHQPDL